VACWSSQGKVEGEKKEMELEEIFEWVARKT